MAGRGRGGAGTKGRGRGADASGAAKARRPGAKGDRNSGEDGQDSDLLILGEAPAQKRPPRPSSSASLSGTGAGSEATDAHAAKDPSFDVRTDRNRVLGDKAEAATQTGARQGNGTATDAGKHGMDQTHGHGQDPDVQVLTQVGMESTDVAGATRAGAAEGNGPAADAGNDLARAGEAATNPELDEEQEINKGLEELQNLCLVLGINYESKVLLEFGGKVDKQRLNSSIVILRTTLVDNFQQLQIIANELLNAWTMADSSYERMSKLAWTLTVRDASGPESVTAKGYLAASLIARAKKEARSIQDEALRKIRDKYLAKRKKLTKMLSKSHLVPLDVEFDPNKTVNPDQYKAEKQYLKDCIRKAKGLVADRKELVLRVELVQNYLKSKASLPFCPALIGDARKTVLKMKELSDAEILFDGVEIDDFLNGLEKTCKTMQLELEEIALKKNEQTKSRTRSGRVPRSSS